MAARLAGLLAGLLALWPATGLAHDAASWGGLFRTSDDGASWFQSNRGRLVSGALSVAVSPSDSTYLLLGTDGGLLGSRNGGLDWEGLAPDLLTGPVFAVASDGAGALAGTDQGIFRSHDGVAWRTAASPPGASPARAILGSAAPGRAYLVGWQGLYRTDDWGGAWEAIDRGLPEPRVSALLVIPGSPEPLFALVGGSIWVSLDEARTWELRATGLPVGAVQALAVDPERPTTLWAAGSDQVFRSDDRGDRWIQIGQPLPDRGTEIRGLAPGANGAAIVLSTHRGLYRSQDGGQTWTLLSDQLPGHVEAGPLIRDPSQPSVLYAGFSLTPYGDQWTRAAEGRSTISQLRLADVAGAAAFLAMLGLGAGLALQALSRSRRVPPVPAPPAGLEARQELRGEKVVG